MIIKSRLNTSYCPQSSLANGYCNFAAIFPKSAFSYYSELKIAFLLISHQDSNSYVLMMMHLKINDCLVVSSFEHELNMVSAFYLELLFVSQNLYQYLMISESPMVRPELQQVSWVVLKIRVYNAVYLSSKCALSILQLCYFHLLELLSAI